MALKRKAEGEENGQGSGRAGPKKSKLSLSADAARKRFRDGLFDKAVLDSYTKEYAASTPYKHAVIHQLVDDALLRSVRDEVRGNVQFTPKETDIYKIHQSGDLANLDGLDDDSLAKLPSLLALRDAIYSDSFRKYVSDITGCGPLSGRKTDMAINVYTPGCFLLCHDDVIGSRKVSYILYLTDPDKPWQPEWGGALRLFPVREIKNDSSGEVAKTPLPDPVKIIPPAWNQLSFFAVQPGESFHDVEEVYHAETKEQLVRDHGRVRMAISGWFHVPQLGEEGYVEGEEEKNAQNSSLMQLQGNPAQYDAPQAKPVVVAPANPSFSSSSSSSSTRQADFQEADLEFLLRFISPTYLTPDTLEQIADQLDRDSTITLENILCHRFAQRLRAYIEDQERQTFPDDSAAIEKSTPWKVARPPHKHRFLFQRPSEPDELRTLREQTPITELLDTLFPSRAFRQWLQIATRCRVKHHEVIARRFRRGRDYTLATGQDGEELRLELGLGMTPTSGWGDDEQDEDMDEGEGEDEDEDKEAAVEEEGEEVEENAEEKTEEAEEKVEEKVEEKEEEKVEEKKEEKEEKKVEEKEEKKEKEKEEEKEEEKIEEKVEKKVEKKVEEKVKEKAEEVEEKVEEKVEKKAEEVEEKAEEKVEEKVEEKAKEKAKEKVEEKVEDKAEEKAEEAEGKAEADAEQGPTATTEDQTPTLTDKGKGKAIAAPETTIPGSDEQDPDNEVDDNEVDVDVGGVEVYMAGDDPTGDNDDDAAVYKSGSGNADDDTILFYQAATWNKLTLVLRDSGTLKFVKYVSRKAKGDRWDISGTYGIEDVGEGEADGQAYESDDAAGGGLGFSQSGSDSDSD
ncbi:hypothetical protein E4U21_003781 [Claviceps maximensis]|nr:hypothetical protein E4U21_003781 [Claviceps maximensis]